MRKAQFAMEYLLVIGFSLLIILPLIVILSQEYNDQKESVHAEHLVEVAREITYQAEKMYYQGAPSTTTIRTSFPQGLVDAKVTSITNEKTGGITGSIEFELQGSPISIYSDARVPLQGNLRVTPGTHLITITAVDDGTNTYVRITDN